MKNPTFLLLTLVFFGAIPFPSPTSAEQAKTVFRVRAIDQITNGTGRIKKLYYKLNCDERGVQLLTETMPNGRLAIAELVSSEKTPCQTPPRTEMTRIMPGSYELVPVDHFQEVWYCSGWCDDRQNPPGSPYPPDYRFVQSFGTSQRQARSSLSCNTWVTNLQCTRVPIESRFLEN